MKTWNIAVLGATGAVGREMIRLLEEYRVPVGRLLPLASRRSAGEELDFQGEKLRVEAAEDQCFAGLDFVLGAVESETSRRYAPLIRESGAVYIDNSSAFRLEEDVPLVVPEINGEDAFTHRGVIANPNCSTIIAMMAAAPIAKRAGLRSVTACTYQAVSGAGLGGIRELRRGIEAAAEGRAVQPQVFPAPIAMNLIPWIGSLTENGYTDEEMKMQNEGRRILHRPELQVCCSCVRVPVLRSHAIAMTLRTETPISPAEAEEAIRAFPGLVMAKDAAGRDWPTPLDTTGQDAVWVGRVRRDETQPNALALFCCGDQIRKGAAGNAVQILQLLTER